MIDLPSPAGLIPSAEVTILRNYAATAEQLGQLHEKQLDLIYHHKWFLLFVPATYGGLQLPLPQGVRLLEALACADGSTAWVVTLCSGANWFSGFLEPELALSLFKNAKACIAGSGQSTGVAVARGNGYEVSGSWGRASGALHATAFTANCRVEGEEGPGTFLFLREEVQVQRTWRAIGMTATGSHTFEVAGKHLEQNRRFFIDSSRKTVDLPLYDFPFLQLAEATLAANSSGMGMRFLQLCAEQIEGASAGTSPHARRINMDVLGENSARLTSLRQSFYQALDAAWNNHMNGGAINPDALALISKSSFELARGAYNAVNELYPYAGLRAADPETEINRVWRNLHTASQHAVLRYPPEV